MPGSVPSYAPFAAGLGPNIVVRTEYEQLFHLLFKLNAPKKIAIVGNPGTGKSWLQLYIIWRLLHAETDSQEELFLPRCVVQQLGQDQVLIYSLHDLTVWTATFHKDLLTAFHTDEAVYLFNPALHPNSLPQFSTLRSMVTTSPKRERYKEFLKGDGVEYYMPVWRLEELLGAGQWIQNQLPDGHDLRPLYDPEHIAARFARFGGIVRRALPVHRRELQIVNRNQQSAINKMTFQQLFKFGMDDEDTEASHIFHYKVSPDLQSFRLMFPSRYVEVQLRAKVAAVTFAEALRELQHAMAGNLPERMRLLLETVTHGLLARNVQDWQVSHIPYTVQDAEMAHCVLDFLTAGRSRRIGDVMHELRRQLHPQVLKQRYIRTKDFPGFEHMEENVLYIFGQINFPFVEAVYKVAGVLYGIQCKSGEKFIQFSSATYLRFRNIIRVPPHEPIVIWLVCTPHNCATWEAGLERGAWAAVREGDDGSDVEQRLARESTVFSVVTHTFDPEDVANAGAPTVRPDGPNIPEIITDGRT